MDIVTADWFHGFVSKNEANCILSKQPPNTYLVRFSTNYNRLTISLRIDSPKRVINHIRIEMKEDGKYHLPGFPDNAFFTVAELLQSEKEKFKFICPPIQRTRLDLLQSLSDEYVEGEEEPLISFLNLLSKVSHTVKNVKEVLEKLHAWSDSLLKANINDNRTQVALLYFRSQKCIKELKLYLEKLEKNQAINEDDPFYLLQIGQKRPKDFFS